MDLDPTLIGSRIAQARTQEGISQTELARLTSIDRTALAKIESGSRRVTAVELSSIANRLEQRIEWFLAQPPAAVIAHRANRDPEATNSVIDDLLEELARESEFLQSLDDSLIPQDVPPTFARPKSEKEADDLAGTARKLLGLNALEPVYDIQALMAKIGLLAFSARLGTDTADAGTIALRRGAVAVVNSDNKGGRRRLALAHELGHYLVADEYTVDWNVAEHNVSQAVESQIDHFARALLLPSKALSKLWKERAKQDDFRTSAVVVGSFFRVDMATLARRLLELGLVDDPAASAVRAAKTTQADIVEYNLLVPHELENTSLPRRYQQAILKLFKQGRISGARAAQLLRGTLDEESLPAIPQQPESEIWKLTS